jgi:hypothetical protein
LMRRKDLVSPHKFVRRRRSAPKEVKQQSSSGERSGRAETDIVAVLGRYGVAAV